MIAERPSHGVPADERLDGAGQAEAEDQRPERLPEHEEALAQAAPDVVEQRRRVASELVRHERTSRAMAADASVIFAVGLLATVVDRVGHAVGQVVVEQLQRHRLQGLRRRRDLLEHVDAVPVLVDHPLEAPHLPLDPPEPSLHGELVLAVARVHGGLLWSTFDGWSRSGSSRSSGRYPPGV